MSVQGHLDWTKSRHLTVKVDRVLEMARFHEFQASLALQAGRIAVRQESTNKSRLHVRGAPIRFDQIRLDFAVGMGVLPARPSVRYKDAFVPRRFSNNSLPLYSPHTTPVVSKASASSTFSCMPPPFTERYDATCRKNTSARPPVSIRSTPP